MPAPPPPSKSYLLKFDDLSTNSSEDGSLDTPTEEDVDNDEDEVVVVHHETRRCVRGERDSANFASSFHPTTTSSSSNNKNYYTGPPTNRDESYREDQDKESDDEEEDDEDDGLPQQRHKRNPKDGERGNDIDEHISSSSKYSKGAGGKKRRKKKKKRKGKKEHATAAAALEIKQVRFGVVAVYEFGRCFGMDAVPGNGGWPLGMEMKALAMTDHHDCDHLDYSVDDYENQKHNRLLIRWKDLMMMGKTNGTTEIVTPSAFETRQFDFTTAKNPLFQKLCEKDRMKLLVSFHSADSESPQNSPSSSSDKKTKHHRTSSRSNTRSRSGSITEDFGEAFNSTEVLHIRNELERIRSSRSSDGSTGCTCRKLQVYIPPPNAGKKAQSRRLSVLKLKDELRKRHLLPKETKTREELELLLFNAVENEPCCVGDDCECHRNGITCQADTCSCWLASHQTSKGKSLTNQVSVNAIKARCGNKYGMYVVDFDGINKFRNELLCQVISN